MKKSDLKKFFLFCVMTLSSWFVFVPTAYADLTANVMGLTSIIQDFAIICGLGLVLGAFFKFKKYGEQRGMMSQHSIMEPLAMLFCGAMLLSTPSILTTFLLAFWGTGKDAVVTPGSVSPDEYATILMVRIFGVISFIRGLLQLARAGKESGQPGQIGKGLTFIFSGILMVHIVETVTFVSSFFSPGNVT